MINKLTQGLRLRETIIVVFTALLLISSTQLWVGCVKEGKTTHYLKTVGSCDRSTTIEIYDETGGIDPTVIKTADQWGDYTYQSKPTNTIEDKHFKNYVTTISKYVFAKVDALGVCQGALGQPKVELVFVYRPAISRGIVPLDFQPKESQDTKQLDSPWVKLTLDRSPQLDVKAVFIWNERQFLLDQALKFGVHSPSTRSLLPIALETFDRWQKTDEDLTSKENLDFLKQLPMDIRWLFAMERRTMFLPKWSGGKNLQLSVDDLKDLAKGEKIGYIDLNKSLID